MRRFVCPDRDIECQNKCRNEKVKERKGNLLPPACYKVYERKQSHFLILPSVLSLLYFVEIFFPSSRGQGEQYAYVDKPMVPFCFLELH